MNKELTCKTCGKQGYKINTASHPKDFCCFAHYEKWRQFNIKPNCKCVICGKEMYLKPYRLKRTVTGVVCGAECFNELARIRMIGNKNHQYGLKGDKNASFKNKLTKSCGYYMEYVPDHPYANRSGRIRQHRVIVERNYELYDQKFFTKINGYLVLKKEYDVHHINEIKTDNRVENLMVLTRGEHSTLHNKTKSIKRNLSNGRIIGVVKQEELLGNLEVDNQQPS